MTTKPHKSEAAYFVLRVIFSLLGLFLIGLGLSALFSNGNSSITATGVMIIVYVLLFVLYFRFVSFLMIGHLRGNGIEIGEGQFPEVFSMTKDIAALYGMKKAPKVFLVQSGGILNAYATRFVGKDYVAIYSDVFSLVERDEAVLRFVLAHEFAHVKRRHVQKRFWTFLSFYVPFLGPAYSRSCEYSCDAYGREASPQGAVKGLLLLAAGKDLYGRVDVAEYMKSFAGNNSPATRFAEKFSSHPNLPKRIAYLGL